MSVSGGDHLAGVAPMIDYAERLVGNPGVEPAWLKAQREQAIGAGVGLSDLAPACSGNRHEFDPGAIGQRCQCGKLRQRGDRATGRIWVYVEGD